MKVSNITVLGLVAGTLLLTVIAMKQLASADSELRFSSFAQAQEHLQFAENIAPFTFPKTWGRLVEGSHSHWVFEATDGTLRFAQARGDGDVVEVYVIRRK